MQEQITGEAAQLINYISSILHLAVRLHKGRSRGSGWTGCALFAVDGHGRQRQDGVRAARLRKTAAQNGFPCVPFRLASASTKAAPNTKTAPLGCRFCGGSGWIRTTEGVASRFTVCPLWPLGNAPIFGCAVRRQSPPNITGAGERSRTINLLITNQLLCH